MQNNIDKYFMKKAINEAKKAYKKNEIPIGSIITYKEKIISKSYNQIEKLNNPIAHAEIIAINLALQYKKNKYLTSCTLYVNIEPCIMCIGAIYFSKLFRVVAGDLK